MSIVVNFSIIEQLTCLIKRCDSVKHDSVIRQSAMLALLLVQYF